MARSIWSYGKVQRFISWLIRNKASFYRRLPNTPFLLDIGPGSNISLDFYNIDWAWTPGVDRCCDITKGLRLPDSSVAGVYSEHCLEHISPDATVQLLRELYAAMTNGAWLRVSMPDLELYARKYVASLDTGINEMPYKNLAVAGHEVPGAQINAVIREHGHLYVYDFQLFSLMLSDVGFRNIRRCSFRQGSDTRLLKDAEHRQCESFYVEAQKISSE